MWKKFLSILFCLIVTIAAGISHVNARSNITIDDLKNKLESSSIIKQYNVSWKISGRSLYFETNDLLFSVEYFDGILDYSIMSDINMATYVLNRDSMSKEKFTMVSQQSANIISEVVACVADLYGYPGYHNDWIGHILPNDYENKGISYDIGSVDGVFVVYSVKLNLNGPFEATLKEQKLNSNQNKNHDVIIPNQNQTQEVIEYNQNQDSNVADSQVVTSPDINDSDEQEVVESNEEENLISKEEKSHSSGNGFFDNCLYIIFSIICVSFFCFLFRKSLFTN